MPDNDLNLICYNKRLNGHQVSLFQFPNCKWKWWSSCEWFMYHCITKKYEQVWILTNLGDVFRTHSHILLSHAYSDQQELKFWSIMSYNKRTSKNGIFLSHDPNVININYHLWVIDGAILHVQEYFFATVLFAQNN